MHYCDFSISDSKFDIAAGGVVLDDWCWMSVCLSIVVVVAVVSGEAESRAQSSEDAWDSAESIAFAANGGRTESARGKTSCRERANDEWRWPGKATQARGFCRSVIFATLSVKKQVDSQWLIHTTAASHSVQSQHVLWIVCSRCSMWQQDWCVTSQNYDRISSLLHDFYWLRVPERLL